MPECSPPMTPARPSGLFSSAMTSTVSSSVISRPSSSLSVSPCSRATHDDAAVEFAQVVRMHRLAELEHHVVRDVDGRADRTQAGATQPLLHPGRRLAPWDRARGSRATQSARNPHPASSVDRKRVVRRRRRPARYPGPSSVAPVMHGDFARDAEHAHAIAAVRRQIHFEDRVVELQRLDQGRARRQVRRQVRAGRSRLRRGPVRAPSTACPNDSTPRSLALLDLACRPAASRRSWRAAPSGRRAHWARRRRSARLSVPVLTWQTLSVSAFGCWHALEDLADDHAGQRRRGGDDAFDLETGHRQARARVRAARQRPCRASHPTIAD